MAFLSGFKNTVLLWVLVATACGNPSKKVGSDSTSERIETPGEGMGPIIVAANRTSAYLPLLTEKKVGVVANQTSVIFKMPNAKSQIPNAKYQIPNAYVHLVDSLLSLQVDIKKVFAPEHGFRGQADAGEKVADGMDTKTGLPLISLYGKNRKPSAEQLSDLDVVLFDIQDVGVRFYTYIATLQLVMKACAENDVPLIVLDRPNPNGHYVDGPTMEMEHSGFLGMTPIPLVYGMTIGEYAQMINGEGWLENKAKAELTVIQLENWTYTSEYPLPIRPSPNLPSDVAINLYPSLGLFEGTNVNAGRGTEYQFQRYGASFLDSTQYSFTYTPKPNFGSKSPKQDGKKCFGKDLSKQPKINEVSLLWLMDAYMNAGDQSKVFNTKGFTRHAGTDKLQQLIEGGKTEAEIKATWQPDIDAFKKIRKKYLMYEH